MAKKVLIKRVTCSLNLDFSIDPTVAKTLTQEPGYNAKIRAIEAKLNALITHGTLNDAFAAIGFDLISGEAKVASTVSDED